MDIDYVNLITNLLPPDKRTPVRIAFLTAYAQRIAVDSSIYFQQYIQGSSDQMYAPGTYSRRAIVIYNGQVFQSKFDNNNALPTDATMWRLIAPSFIGVDQRISFRVEKIIFEYALNLRFNTVFRQPPGTSDIYITTNYKNLNAFIVGYTEAGASDIGYDATVNAIGDVNDDYSPYYQLTINVPTAVYAAVGLGAIKSFADKYVVAGIFYNVVTY